MCKKNDKPGVYDINGRVIDIFGINKEVVNKNRHDMSREDFIEYAVDVDMAARKAWEDGVLEFCEEMGDFSDDELRQIFREFEESVYDRCVSKSSKHQGSNAMLSVAKNRGVEDRSIMHKVYRV